MNYENLVFLGTSHIAKQSLQEVQIYIEKEKPQIIAIELDKKRLAALMQKQRKLQLRAIRQIGLKGFLFSAFGAWAERKLGKLVGVAPGSEMKLAVKIAKKEKIRLALIDQDIEITLKRLSHEISWREKKSFLIDIIKSIFLPKKEIGFDLRTVPDKKIIKQLTDKLKQKYPNVHKVLIEERNKVIAENLKNLATQNPDKKILIILGAGHVEDVIKLLKNRDESSLRYSFSFSA